MSFSTPSCPREGQFRPFGGRRSQGRQTWFFDHNFGVSPDKFYSIAFKIRSTARQSR